MPGFDPAKVAGLAGTGAYPNSTGAGPDFPEAAGDREKGKFRTSQYPRLTTVAVVNDDGSAVGAVGTSAEVLSLDELRGIRLGIQKLLEYWTGYQNDLVQEAKGLPLGL